MPEKRDDFDSPITVERVLNLPALRRGAPEVVAGRGTLNRPIRWVHSGEVRRMATLLKGGELLLTTGMGIGANVSDQESFVAELAERGVAAVVIELGSRFAELPTGLVAAAERSGVPLIALHREVPFVEITEAVHQAIVNRRFELMRRAGELRRRFSDLLLGGAGIAEVLEALAETIANPVLIETDRHGVLFQVGHEASEQDVMAAWGAVSADRPDAPDALAVAIPMGAGETYGRLVALALDSPLTELDRVAVEQAVALVALALLRSREEEVLQARQRGNVLAGLVEGQIDEVDAMARAEQLGFPTPQLMLPIVVAPTPGGGRARGFDDVMWAALWRDLQRALDSRRLPALHGVRPMRRELLLVLGAPAGRSRADLIAQAVSAVREVAGRRAGAPDALLVCAGGLARTWAGVREGLADASASVPAAARRRDLEFYDATRPSLDRLLGSLRDHTDLVRFVDARLRPLLEHDATRRVKLLPTLRAYCEHGGRRAETARALHLERQSLYHRIARIEQLLEVDLRDADELLGLHLALRAREHMVRGWTT